MTNLNELLFSSSFLIFIILMLSIDLGFFQKHTHALSFKEALGWTILWISISIGFYFFIRFHGNLLHGSNTIDALQRRIDLYHHPVSIQGLTVENAIREYNRNLSLEYLTGYLIEYSLSVDNVFVIIMIFMSFNIKPRFFKRVLFWGILGAVVMRFFFIFAASALIQRFFWFLYIFGFMLVGIGIRMGWEFLFSKKSDQIDTEKHPVVRVVSRFFRVEHNEDADSFFVWKEGKLYVTTLFIVLMIIEFSDVIFAVDSVPAVFSVTQDPYIVFFSNIFAILGLRSLFFLIMDVMGRFHYLKLGLAFLLTFVGVKMLIHDWWKISTVQSLLIIVAILTISMMASLIRNHLRKSTLGASS